jgi:hypothetical protein
MCAESAAVRESDVLLHEWNNMKLRQILDTFSPRDIYNADETGFFWKALALIALWLLKMKVFQVVNCP